MAELHDASKPSGHLIEVREDGSALRNDGVELSPAGQNPWYVLATVYGETESYFSAELIAKNRRIWNGWICTRLSHKEREAVAKKAELQLEDVAELTDIEDAIIRDVFEQRLGPDIQVPKCTSAVGLSDLYFDKSCVLDKFLFLDTVTFDRSVFGGNGNFNGSCFYGPTTFEDCLFIHDVSFHGVAFRNFATFAKARFSSFIHFSEATFNGVEFYRTLFTHGAAFEAALFNNYANFGKAEFRSRVDFSDNKFAGSTKFANADFKGYVPKFFQRDFHQDTEFSTDPALWPDITPLNANESKRAYTRLRKVMNELQNPDDEHFFFRQEMECKRHLENWWNRWPIHLFKWLSDYGHSVTRPVAWLAGAVVVGGSVIGSYLRTKGTTGNASIWEGLGVSFANTFPFLGFGRKMHPDFFDKAPAWLDAFSGLQSILGVILLFFVGLALRNRFRIK